ncbi:CCAAT-binding transcription factor [Macleaya cordata]|uniref:Nuclear transcription factor Y subunit n=1 Tax=Macleaya cordata TaxID=56857 RepID=A0A200R346_MACCD|nr:CCAAT-binding transcription factor [Macleaya cordata]
MQTVFFKEHGGIVHNPIAQPSPLPSVPWWGVLGSQPVYGGASFQLKSLTLEQNSDGNQLPAAPRQAQGETGQRPEKENYNNSQFTGCPGVSKDPRKGQNSQELPQTISQQSSPTEYQSHFELGLGQPMVCANYPYMDHHYGLFATYGAPTTARMMLPLNAMTENGPIYVNAKQYNGIIRRRQYRAKAELENKAIKARKPYLHESRHLHAKRRARGCGGRFLAKNNRKGGTDKNEAQDGQLSHPAGSPSSEVLQSESGNLNSSEVTSIYTRGHLDHFQIDHLRSSAFRSLPNMTENGQNVGIPNKWVTAADGCCNLLRV